MLPKKLLANGNLVDSVNCMAPRRRRTGRRSSAFTGCANLDCSDSFADLNVALSNRLPG